MPSTPFSPSWKKYEQGIRSEDNKTARKATDKFLAERDYALATDSQAKRWEAGRRAGWDRDKPVFVKEQREREQEAGKKLIKDLKTGGSYDQKLKPAPGYVIVEVVKVEEKTASGVYLAPEALVILHNTGTVVEVGGATKDLDPPCKVGERVMFKKGAGMELAIEGKDCQMMTFPDILGVFYA